MLPTLAWPALRWCNGKYYTLWTYGSYDVMSPTSAGLDADTLLCLCQHELHQGSSGLGREVRGRGGLEVGEDQLLEELERSGRTLCVCVHVCACVCVCVFWEIVGRRKTNGLGLWQGTGQLLCVDSLVPSRPSFFSLPVRKSGTPGNTSHVRDVRFNERGHG